MVTRRSPAIAEVLGRCFDRRATWPRRGPCRSPTRGDRPSRQGCAAAGTPAASTATAVRVRRGRIIEGTSGARVRARRAGWRSRPPRRARREVALAPEAIIRGHRRIETTRLPVTNPGASQSAPSVAADCRRVVVDDAADQPRSAGFVFLDFPPMGARPLRPCGAVASPRVGPRLGRSGIDQPSHRRCRSPSRVTMRDDMPARSRDRARTFSARRRGNPQRCGAGARREAHACGPRNPCREIDRRFKPCAVRSASPVAPRHRAAHRQHEPSRRARACHPDDVDRRRVAGATPRAVHALEQRALATAPEPGPTSCDCCFRARSPHPPPPQIVARLLPRVHVAAARRSITP